MKSKNKGKMLTKINKRPAAKLRRFHVLLFIMVIMMARVVAQDGSTAVETDPVDPEVDQGVEQAVA